MNIHSLTILSFFAVLCYSSFSHARADIFPVKQKLLGKSAYLPRVQSNPIVVDGPLITANSYQAIWTHPGHYSFPRFTRILAVRSESFMEICRLFEFSRQQTRR